MIPTILILKPSPILAPYIKYYKYIESDLKGTYKCIPITNVELYFNFTHVNLFSKNYFNIDNPRFFVTGLLEPDQKTYSHMYGTNRGGGFAIVFQPLGFHSLFRIKSSDLSKFVIPADLIFKKDIEQTWMQMEHEVNVDKMKNIVEKFLLKYAHNVQTSNRFIEPVMDYMNFVNGVVRISQVCQKYNITRRKLERSFKEETGLTARDFLSIYRLNYALKLLSSKPDYDFTEVSYLCGYYDQSHFIKDIRNRTSFTPGELINQNDRTMKSVANVNFIKNKEN